MTKHKAASLSVIPQEDLMGLDELLSWYEDLEHGELGKRITYLRAKITNCKPLIPFLSDAWDAGYEAIHFSKRDEYIKENNFEL